MISRLNNSPGRSHSIFQPRSPKMGTRSKQKNEDEDDDNNGQVKIVISKNTNDNDSSDDDINNIDADDSLVTINVGGRVFQTYRRTLMKLPHTRLAILSRISPAVNTGHKRMEMFFDRNPDMFAAVLSFYRDDTLHMPSNVCPMAFCKELEFWGLNETWLADCCQKLYNDAVGSVQMSKMMREEFVKAHPRRVVSNPGFTRTRRGRLWEFLDNPVSSTAAKVWFLFFYIFLLITVVNVFVSTHPACRVPMNNLNFTPHYHTNTTSSTSNIVEFLTHQAEINPKINILLYTRPHGAVILLELLSASYFTIEFLFRSIVCPHKRVLFRSFLTWCDLVYIIPLWCELIASYVAYNNVHTPEMLPWKLVLKTLMVLRVVRIFTLAKHYRALRVLLLSIRASLKEILLLLCFVMFAMIIFASLVYCAEIFKHDSFFDTLFSGLWWSLITMTTVGYGDVVPKSGVGYVIGAACALTGIIIIGMPVPIITSNFHLYYGFQTTMDKQEKEEEEHVVDVGKSVSSDSKTKDG